MAAEAQRQRRACAAHLCAQGGGVLLPAEAATLPAYEEVVGLPAAAGLPAPAAASPTKPGGAEGGSGEPEGRPYAVQMWGLRKEYAKVGVLGQPGS